MASVMAIVAKAVFEKAAGKSPKPGDKLGMDRYVSANKNLAPLAAGGRLYLVTVRPPSEALWLVAVLEQPAFDGTQWTSAASQTPITDITALRGQLKFESGKGITAAAGALGMSLQTPRVLAAADTALLDAAVRGEAAPAQGSIDQRARLLAAVIGDPDSDTARAVFADELSSHGDPRGELILLELALAGPLSIRKREHLKARRDELKAEHGATWWPHKGAHRTHRGFVEAITATQAQLKPELFAAEPIVEVTVTGVDDAAAAKKLAKQPWLAQVRRLIVRGSIGDDGFAALVASKHTQQLTGLNVTGNGLGAAALAGLGGHLPRCRTLVLTRNPIGDAGVAALTAWKSLNDLEVLYLSGCRLTSLGVATLAAAPVPSLVKLCLSDNQLTDDFGPMFARLRGLRWLELKRTGVGIAAVEALARALPELRLDVRRNQLTEQDVAAYAPRVRGGRA